MIRQRAISILMTAVTLAVASTAVAERVGYRFEGELYRLFTDSATLFGVPNIPVPSAVKGTFSYDTTSLGVTGSSGTVSYPQRIDAGFTLDVAGGMLRISMNNFKINVTNDFHRMMPVETVDTVDIRYKAGDPLTPGPLYVNGQPWPGTASDNIILELTYPPDTLSDVSLPAVLPQTFSTAAYSGLGNNVTGNQLFEIMELEPIALAAGDYNVDGAFGRDDFDEWRRAYGETIGAVGYGDGNGDGIIDGADYVILRHAMAATGSGNALEMGVVPEPAGIVLAWASFVVLLNSRRNRFHHRRRM